MFPALYAILDATPDQPADALESLARTLAAASVQLIQIRAKRVPPREFQKISKSLVIHAPGGVRIIINDRPDIAAIVGASGVHLGQEDLPADAARKICPSPQWVGVSTHNLKQLRVANATSADYIAVGPIFETLSKENPDPAVGLDLLRAARQITRKPLVAIGGITVQSAAEVFRAGADSVAVISDLMTAADPAQRAREYLAIAQQTISSRT